VERGFGSRRLWISGDDLNGVHRVTVAVAGGPMTVPLRAAVWCL